MTKRDFFILMIKLFGLFAVVNVIITTLPSYMSLVYTEYQTVAIFAFVGSAVFSIALFAVLIYYAHAVVDLLKLDKGFQEERIAFGNLSAQDIIKLGTFIIGGPMIINGTTDLLYIIFTSFKSEMSHYEEATTDNSYWIYDLFTIIVGFILITQFDKIAKLLSTEKK